MLVKLDENLSLTHAEFLRHEGYDCDRVFPNSLNQHLGYAMPRDCQD
jgi:hypothetical protein